MDAANCFVCLSRSYFDKFLVLYPIRGFCQHSQSNFSSSPTFRVSKIAVIFNLLVTLSLLYPAASYLQSLKIVCPANRSLCLLLMGDQVYLISSIILETVIAVKIETIRQEMLSWMNIFEHRRFYDLGDIVDKPKLRKFVIGRNVAIMVSLFGATIAGIYLFSNHAYDNLPRSVARKISVIVASIIEGCIFLEAFHKIFFMGALLDAMKTALRQTHFNKDFNVFSKLIHLLAAINYCTKLIMNVTSVLLILWIFTTIIFLIFNIHALTDYVSYDFLTIMLMQEKALFFVMGCTLFFYVHDDNLKKKVSFSLLHLCK
jgi:hypothetical protein